MWGGCGVSSSSGGIGSCGEVTVVGGSACGVVVVIVVMGWLW